MDIDSVCGSNPDQFVDGLLLLNDVFADSYDNHDILGYDSAWRLNNSTATSSDCCSAAVSEALSPNCYGAGASEAVSLAEQGSRSADHQLINSSLDHDNQDPHNHLQIKDNPIKLLSGCDIDLLRAQESDGEDVMSMETDEDEVQSESTVKFLVPVLGMKFSSEEEAYKFYTTYAKKIGFRVRKGKVTRLSDRTIRTRYFYCSREGFRDKKESTNTAAKCHRRETRTGCEAMVHFTVEKNGEWVISRFSPHHNHELEGKSKLTVGAHINALEDHLRSTFVNKDKTRVESEAEEDTEAANSITFHDNYHASFLIDEKTNCILLDGQSLIDCFRNIQLDDPSFFYTVQVNHKNCLTSFFWTDGRSIIDYDCFGDALVLDTTLIDANSVMSATFLGLNHHGEYVLFGGALLLDCSIASFVWLFRTFMEVMGGRQPKTIFTDLYQSIEAAIKAELPQTRHLLGTWYILQNARKHLPRCYGQPDFDRLLKKCILDSQSEGQFESMWESLLEQYELRDDPCLKSLHESRRKWPHCCSDSFFSAGLQSIQSHESISKFCQKLTSEIKSPSDFVLHYLKIAEQQRREELAEDICGNERPPKIILRGSAMEKQAAKVYTNTMFRLFQEELLECLSLGIEEVSSDGMINATKFKLIEESGKKENTVEFNCLESSVKCSCKKYESVGILCVHALKVLNAKNIFHIPPQYILKRWTKSAKDAVVDEQESEREVADESLRHRKHLYKSKLMSQATDVITKSLAVDQQKSWTIVENYLDMALKRVEEVTVMKNSTGNHGTEDIANAHCIATDHAGTSVNSSKINQKEVSDGRVEVQLKRKRENEACRPVKSKSSDGAIALDHHSEVTTEGDDHRPRRAFSQSNFMEENSQHSSFRSSRPPLPSQSTFFQFRDHSKASVSVQECWKERAMRSLPEKRTIMGKMEEMEKEILKLKNEQRMILASSNKSQRSKSAHLP